jgi:hypothetical protein
MAFGGFLEANTAVDVMVGPFVDEDDGKTAETLLVISQADVRLSKNGGNMAQKNEATSLAHDELGNYVCKLNGTDTNTEGILTLMIHEAGALPIKMDYQIISQAAHESLITAKDAGFMDVNIKSVGRADAQETEANNLESACSNYSVTRGLSGTALPAAAADAVGGLPISDAGGLDLDTKIGLGGYNIGAVWFDTGGAAGATSFVNGIITNPCSSPANTHTLLTNLNLKVVRVVAGSTYNCEATYSGYSFIGEKWTFAPSGQQLINCYFEGCTITAGVFHANSTGCQFTKCQLATVTLPAGATAATACTVRESGLSGTFTVGAAGIFTFENSYSEGAAATPFILDFAAVGATTINLSNFAGGVDIRNMAAGDAILIDGTGQITVNANCAAGNIYIRGAFELITPDLPLCPGTGRGTQKCKAK